MVFKEMCSKCACLFVGVKRGEKKMFLWEPCLPINAHAERADVYFTFKKSTNALRFPPEMKRLLVFVFS